MLTATPQVKKLIVIKPKTITETVTPSASKSPMKDVPKIASQAEIRSRFRLKQDVRPST